MSTFECPHCKAEHNIGDYPDHLTDMRNNRFPFECHCGAEFECAVDWDPDITPDESTLKASTQKAGPPRCSARQLSDQMSCQRCDLVWDMNDPNPPSCKGQS